MQAKAMIRRALNRVTPATTTTVGKGTGVPSGAPDDLASWERDLLATPTPVAVASPSDVMIFRSMLLRREAQGPALRATFDRLNAAHPEVGAAVVDAGALGTIMWNRAIEALVQYRATGVASAPVAPRSL